MVKVRVRFRGSAMVQVTLWLRYGLGWTVVKAAAAKFDKAAGIENQCHN